MPLHEVRPYDQERETDSTVITDAMEDLPKNIRSVAAMIEDFAYPELRWALENAQKVGDDTAVEELRLIKTVLGAARTMCVDLEEQVRRPALGLVPGPEAA